MLLSHSSSLFYPPTQHYVGKYCSNTNVVVNPFHLLKSNRNSRKNDQPHKRYSCVTRHGHPSASELLPAVAADPESESVHGGVGILPFFEGKNIFVTGSTGLLGKVFVEKILRSTSVGKVYLLIKAKDKEAAFHRIQNEVINSELFTSVKEKYGQCYVREKVIAIVGDICAPYLGMDYESIEAVRKNVDVIIHCAANTTFNGRYDVIFDTNVMAPQRLMRFAKTCNKLQLFTHVSTAFVNARDGLEGIILEKPLIMGNDDVDVDVNDEISLLLKSSTMLPPNDVTKFFKDLGQRRAEAFGWRYVYMLSKAMGEMILNESRGDTPLLIIRPSVVESCYKEPLSGWIPGNRMFDPVIISYGKGVLPAYFGNPQVHLDLIPVDFVVNTMIAAIAKHGNTHIAEPKVYHVASSVWNPITYSDVFQYMYQYFSNLPLTERPKNIAKVNFFDSFDEFSKYTREEIFRRNMVGEDKKLIWKNNAQVEYAQQLCKLYEFAGFFKGRFHTGNTEKLVEEMSKEEQLDFEVNVGNINWKKYIEEIHVPGLRKHVVNCARVTQYI